MTPYGVYISTKTLKDYDCSKGITAADLLFGIYLKDLTERKNFFKCYNQQNLFKLSKIQINSIVINLSKQELEKLESFSVSDSAEKMEKLFKKTMSFKYTLETAYRLVKELELHKNILSELLQVYVYIISDNQAKAEGILKRLMNKELLYYSLNSEIKSLSIKKQILMSTKILKKIKLDISSEKVFSNFIFYLYINSTGDFQKSLKKEFTINRSSSYLREQYKSVQFGKPFPHVWGSSIFNMGSQFEYTKFIEDSAVGINRTTQDHILFFRGVLGINKKYKDTLIKAFKKLENTNEFYLKQVYFRMLNDELFFKFISAHLNKKIGLVASLKRKFYKSTIRHPVHFQYSIQELISLGDFNFNYILKIMAFEHGRL